MRGCFEVNYLSGIEDEPSKRRSACLLRESISLEMRYAGHISFKITCYLHRACPDAKWRLSAALLDQMDNVGAMSSKVLC